MNWFAFSALPVPVDHRLLQTIPLFAGLRRDQLAAVGRHAVVRNVPRNTVLIRQGDAPEALYMIISGRARVSITGEDGKELVLDSLGPGEYFGELALIDGEPRSATVTTASDATVGVISRGEFEACLADTPEIAIGLLRGLSHRVRELDEQLRDFALLDVRGRLLRVLQKLARDGDGRRTEPVTQQELANMVGASREMVSRVLNHLKSDGVIAVQGKAIVLLGPRV